VFVVLTIVAFGIWAGADALAGEKFKLRTSKASVKWEKVEVGSQEGHALVVEEGKGIITNMEGKWFGDGWVLRHFGLIDMNTKTGVVFGHGYEEITDKDGDKYFNKWEGKATGESTWEGTYVITGGTGKYRGIKGSGTFSLLSVSPDQWFTDEQWDIELP
jgi:hypothetical protein